MPYNYELIYKVNESELDINDEKTMIWRAENAARIEAKKEYKDMSKKLTALLGTDDWEIASYYCPAKGIGKHVWSPAKGKPDGVGHKKCVFCGNDDFDI